MKLLTQIPYFNLLISFDVDFLMMSQPTIQRLEHLGLIADFCREIK